MDDDPSAILNLKELIYPILFKEFFDKYWSTSTPIFIPGDLQRFKNYDALLKINRLENFISEYSGKVSLIHRNKTALDVQGGSHAFQSLKDGYTAYFRNVEDYFPEIKKSLAGIAHDLDVPKMTSEIFISRGMSGVSMHSDYHMNLNLLLSGQKEWSYSKNENIENQTSICMPAKREQVDPTQLQFLIGDLPEVMPDSSENVIQRAGDLIFMPRGWWHSTRSSGECVSLNFIFKSPTWAHLFSQELEKELLNEPSWRAYAQGMSGRNETKNPALQDLIESFKKKLQGESSHDVSKRLIENYLKNLKN